MTALKPTIMLLIIACTVAQAPGDGISKQTYAATDPQGTFTWLSKYLPIHCGDSVSMCNSTSECGQKGRSNLCPNDACTGSAMSSFMFHFVNTSARPSGPTSVAQVEAIFDEKMGAAFQAQKYDAFMDHAIVFWGSNLDVYVSAFQQDKVPFLPLAWKDTSANQYYSIIFQAPHTQAVVEIISSQKPSSSVNFVDDATARYTKGIFVEMGATTAVSSKILRPLAVSKATSNLDDVIDFYTDALGATIEYNVTYPGGVKMAFFNVGFKSMAGKMQVRFVERPTDATTTSLSVKGLEQIKFAGHDVVHDNKGNNSANIICGFDKWYDNHYGIDGGTLSLTQYKANFDRRGWPYYHAWGGGQGPENVYVVDPTGDSIQLDSSWGAGGAPAGVAGDALGSMCTQGNCKAEYRPTPSTCQTALSLHCPNLSLKYSTCSECVYANWDKMLAGKCMNADAVSYCVGF